MFEVGGRFSIGGDDGPTVGELADLGATEVDHGFDGDGHAGLELGFDFATIVGDVGFLVQRTSDAVADKFADDAVTVGDDEVFDGFGDVMDAVTGAGLVDANRERFLGFLEKPGRGRRDFADGNCRGSVADPAVQDNADIEFDDVGVLNASGAADAMDNFVVNGNADVAGESAVVEEGAASAALVDEPGNEFINLAGGNTWDDGKGGFFEDFTGRAATAPHGLDFF